MRGKKRGNGSTTLHFRCLEMRGKKRGNGSTTLHFRCLVVFLSSPGRHILVNLGSFGVDRCSDCRKLPGSVPRQWCERYLALAPLRKANPLAHVKTTAAPKSCGTSFEELPTPQKSDDLKDVGDFKPPPIPGFPLTLLSRHCCTAVNYAALSTRCIPTFNHRVPQQTRGFMHTTADRD